MSNKVLPIKVLLCATGSATVSAMTPAGNGLGHAVAFAVCLLSAGCAGTVAVAHVGPAPAATVARDLDVAQRRELRGGPDAPLRPIQCGRARLDGPVLAVGSSTMGGVLGLALRRGLEPLGVPLTKWAKSASSVVRPDFYDWAAQLDVLVPKVDPSVVVIELGTNDNQAIWPRRGRGIPTTDPRWGPAFVTLAEELITRAAGEDGQRIVIWIGPYAFPGKGSRVIGHRINTLLRQRLEARGVAAYYVDAYTATLDAERRPITTFTPQGARKPVPARGPDGIHLKTAVVRAVMADPVISIVKRCLRPIP